MKPVFIDSHAHLSAPDFTEDLDRVIQNAIDAGVAHIVTIGAGYGKQSALEAVSLAQRFDCVSAAVGLHPCDSSEKIDSKWLLEVAANPKVRAIGETGLDFYWGKTDPEIQKHNFHVHIEVARALKLPLVIHSRSAAEECLSILKDQNASEIGGVFHCYSEDGSFASRLAEINFLVSFPAVVTFKKAEAARQAVRDIPLSQIMIETDCPFLAPQRVRGKRCEPAYVVDVAETIARERGLTLAEVAAATTANAIKFFRLSL